MPESQTAAPVVPKCPLCGANAFEPEVMTRTDGSISEGWLRCTKCKRYAVNLRSTKDHVPRYSKPHR